MKGLMKLLASIVTNARVKYQPLKLTWPPLNFTASMIEYGVKQTMKPQQTISEVTAALRPAAFTVDVALGAT